MLLLKASLSPTSLGWSHTRSGTQYYKIGCAKNILAKYYRESAFNAVYRLSEHEAAIALSTRTPDVLWLSISLSTTRRTRVFVDERGGRRLTSVLVFSVTLMIHELPVVAEHYFDDA